MLYQKRSSKKFCNMRRKTTVLEIAKIIAKFLRTPILKNIHTFFISNTFISNARLKLEKNQANAKQHAESELFLFEIIHILHPLYHAKIIAHILKNKQNSKCICIQTINHIENEDENEK